MPAMTPDIRASLFMALSMAGFTINDVLAKTASETLNAGQIMFVRGVIMVAVLATFMRLTGRPLLPERPGHPLLVTRVGAETIATILFLVAIAAMPVANVSAILQALPLAVTVGAALFLAEPVGWRRILAILAGLVGVLIVIRPGTAGFDVHALLVVGCVILAAVRDLATRRLPEGMSSLSVSLLTSGAVTLAGLGLTFALGGWKPMSPLLLATLAACAGFLFIGYQFLVLAMRVGNVATVAPFRYTALLWAILLGWLVLGETPDLMTLIGAAVIVASGVYTLYREQVRNRRPRSANRSAASIPPARGT